MTKKPTTDTSDLTAELEGAAAILYTLSHPLLAGDNQATDRAADTTIGNALHGVASFIERISADISELRVSPRPVSHDPLQQ